MLIEVVSTGVDSPPGPPSSWRYHRALAQGARVQVQLRQDDLPQVLRPSPAARDQLPQEEVRPHQPAEAEEEAQVSGTPLAFWLWTRGFDGCAAACVTDGEGVEGFFRAASVA